MNWNYIFIFRRTPLKLSTQAFHCPQFRNLCSLPTLSCFRQIYRHTFVFCQMLPKLQCLILKFSVGLIESYEMVIYLVILRSCIICYCCLTSAWDMIEWRNERKLLWYFKVLCGTYVDVLRKTTKYLDDNWDSKHCYLCSESQELSCHTF
jgi:hypothetical protein